MKRSSLWIPNVILPVVMLATGHANAQVYKCTSFDSLNNKEITIYTDSPCGEQLKQTVINVSVKTNATVSPDQSSLDLRVAQAVLDQDFALAKSLATSKEHWRLISMAEGKQQLTVNTAPIVTNQIAAQNDCTAARNAYESAASARWPDEALITIKKSSMYAACGVAEPVDQNSVIVVGNRYGGIQSSRWIGTPYGPIVYHRPRFNRHHSRHDYDGGGLSINYQSKHFGVRAKTGGLQRQTDIRQQFRTKNFAAQQHSDIRQQFR